MTPASAGSLPDADGWVTLRVEFHNEDEACFVTLGLGPRVDVVEPEALRRRVAAELAATLARSPRAPM